MKVLPILDIPCAEPCMGFEKAAEPLASAINNATEGRLTIGVFGTYGSGKTTLMNAIEKNINDEHGPRITTVKFSAWRYDHEDHLFLPFLSAIHRNKEIWNKPALSNRLHAARRAFIRGLTLEANLGFGKVGFSGDIALKTEDEMLQNTLVKASGDYIDVYNELSHVPLQRNGKVRLRIVVFVDDLDRCVPKKAFALLEQLKSLMDMRGFIFVVGLDPRAIAKSLEKKHESSSLVSLDEYVEKMFQITYYLRSPDNDNLNKAIDAILVKLLEENADKKWLQKINISREWLDLYWPQNMRKVKRILNIHQVIFAEQKESVDADILLGVLILRERWSFIWNLLHTQTEDFDKALLAWRKEMGPDEKVVNIPNTIDNDALYRTLQKDEKNDLKKFFVRALIPKCHDIDTILKYSDLIGRYINTDR